MNNVITRTAEMFVRVGAFGSERTNDFQASSFGAEQFTTVAGVIATVNNQMTTQATGKSSVQQATATRTNAREALRATMQAMAQTVRAMALDTPGLENKFRMPRSGSDQALLYAARAFATDAVPLKAEFLRHEMHATFIEDLLAEIADLERAMGGQNTGRDAHVSATASLDETIVRGMNAVRRLDAIVRNKYRDDPATLAAWESARHVERAPRTHKRTNNGPAKPPSGESK